MPGTRGPREVPHPVEASLHVSVQRLKCGRPGCLLASPRLGVCFRAAGKVRLLPQRRERTTVGATEHFRCASILQDRRVMRAAFRHGGHQPSLSDSIHGFPEWIRVTHWINFFLMGFVIRAGIQILAAYPRLYWNDHCIPGAEWIKLRTA